MSTTRDAKLEETLCREPVINETDFKAYLLQTVLVRMMRQTTLL